MPGHRSDSGALLILVILGTLVFIGLVSAGVHLG